VERFSGVLKKVLTHRAARLAEGVIARRLLADGASADGGDNDQVVSLTSLLLLSEEVPNVAATLTLKPLDALILGFLFDDIRLEAARATKRSGHVDSGTVIRTSPGTQFKMRHPHRRDPLAVSDDDQVVDLLRAVGDELRALRADWGRDQRPSRDLTRDDRDRLAKILPVIAALRGAELFVVRELFEAESPAWRRVVGALNARRSGGCCIAGSRILSAASWSSVTGSKYHEPMCA